MKPLSEYNVVPETPPTSKLVYIAGPMSIFPENFNFPAFHFAEDDLLLEGYRVINPAKHDGGSIDKSWDYYMRIDIKALMDVDAVFVLDRWEESKGAKLEIFIANSLGIPVYSFNTRKRIPVDALALELNEYSEPHHVKECKAEETCLNTVAEEAMGLVYGARNETYDHPFDNFSRIAKIWSGVTDYDFTPEQVALCMVGIKLSREAFVHKRDNIVDGIGYWITLERCLQRRNGLE